MAGWGGVGGEWRRGRGQWGREGEGMGEQGINREGGEENGEEWRMEGGTFAAPAT